MKVIHSIKQLKKTHPFSAVTIGVFDGVHLGHQQIIRRAAEIAAGAERTVITVALARGREQGFQ